MSIRLKMWSLEETQGFDFIVYPSDLVFGPIRPTFDLVPDIIEVMFVWGFTPYQQYYIYLTATVHKSIFPGLLPTSTLPVHYPDTGGPVLVLFPWS